MFDLVGTLCNGCITAEEQERLNSLLNGNLEAQQFYVRYIDIHLALTDCDLLAHIDSDAVLPALFAGLDAYADEPITSSNASSRVLRPSPQPPAPFFLAITGKSLGNYISSGWPVAYLVATVIVGIAALIGSVVYVSHPVQVAKQSVSLPSPISSLSTTVGRITGMVDCKWNGGSRVSLGQKLDLVSGLMEITYDTGAKVILQGPVTYSVETNGGYLAVGKLIGKLEKNSSNPQSLTPNPFVIHTPTAAVTDLGTEFGVEVSESGVTETNVFVGAVQVARIGGKDAADRGITVVRAGQFARVAASKESPVSIGQSRPDAMATRFVRAMPKNVSAADDYAKLVLSMQPFAYYRMERPAAGQDRNVILDSAPGGHHGTLHFSDEWSGKPWEAGRFGDSLVLRGPVAGDYVDVPEFPSADRNQISFSAWIYSWSIEGDRMIVGETSPFPLRKSDTWQFSVELHPVHNLIVHVNQRNKDYALAMEGDTKPFPRAQWRHVAFVADGAMLHVYHNGMETASVPYDGVALPPSPTRLSIGAIWAWSQGHTMADARPTSFFSGRIDELAVFHHALSVQEIRQLFQGKASRSN